MFHLSSTRNFKTNGKMDNQKHTRDELLEGENPRKSSQLWMLQKQKRVPEEDLGLWGLL